RRAGAAHRQRDGPDAVRDVRDGRAQHGDGGARRQAAEPAEPRGLQEIAVSLRYKLLGLDLDGTILGMDLSLDPRDVEGVRRLVDAGVTVIACTGRPFPGALPWVNRLGLTGPIVCYQGAQVRTLDGGVLLDHGVPHDLAMEVVRFARGRDLYVQAYRDDELIVERGRPEATRYAEHAGMDVRVVGDLDAAMGPTTPKLVIVATPEINESILPEARLRWAGRMNVATSVP